MSYSSSTYLTTPVGNNQFAYSERVTTGNAQLYIPAIKKISDVGEVMLGNETVFAEIDTQGKVRTCTGLAYLYVLTKVDLPPIRIMDNHHHAFYARVQWYAQTSSPLTIVHIDQHADMGTTPIPFDIVQKNNDAYLRNYTNEVCTIASFIQPLMACGIVKECMQIRTGSALQELADSLPQVPYILDLDLDFFALSSDPHEEKKYLTQIYALLKSATACTIATSPFFMEQQRAIRLASQVINFSN